MLCILCIVAIYNAYVGISCIQGFVSRKLVVINRYLPAGQCTQPWVESLVLWERGSQTRWHPSIRGLVGAEGKMTMSVQQPDMGRLDDLRRSVGKAVDIILPPLLHSESVSRELDAPWIFENTLAFYSCAAELSQSCYAFPCHLPRGTQHPFFSPGWYSYLEVENSYSDVSEAGGQASSSPALLRVSTGSLNLALSVITMSQVCHRKGE